MTLLAIAEEIADEVRAACSELSIVYPVPTSSIELMSAVVMPAPEWGSFDDGTFCDPDVSFEVTFVAGTTDWPTSMRWLYDRLDELVAAESIGVASWSGVQQIVRDKNGNEGLAVRVRLHPRTLKGS